MKETFPAQPSYNVFLKKDGDYAAGRIDLAI